MKLKPFSEINETETKIEKETMDYFPELGWYKVFFNEYYRIFQVEDLIPEEEKRVSSRLTLILTASIKLVLSSKSAVNLLLKGYYREPLILLRSINEDYVFILFLLYYPEKLNDFVDGKIKSTKILSLVKNYLKEKSKDHYKKEALLFSEGVGSLHGITSRFVHTTKTSIFNMFRSGEDPEYASLPIEPYFDINGFNSTFYPLMVILTNNLDLLRFVFKNKLVEKNMYYSLKQTLDICQKEYLETHESEHIK